MSNCQCFSVSLCITKCAKLYKFSCSTVQCTTFQPAPLNSSELHLTVFPSSLITAFHTPSPTTRVVLMILSGIGANLSGRTLHLWSVSTTNSRITVRERVSTRLCWLGQAQTSDHCREEEGMHRKLQEFYAFLSTYRDKIIHISAQYVQIQIRRSGFQTFCIPQFMNVWEQLQ